MEKHVVEVDTRLHMLKASVDKIYKHIDIITAFEGSPDLYMVAVVEAVRRKTFMEQFMKVSTLDLVSLCQRRDLHQMYSLDVSISMQ